MPDNTDSAFAVTVLIVSAWSLSAFSSFWIAVPVMAAWLLICWSALFTAAMRAFASSDTALLTSFLSELINSCPRCDLVILPSIALSRLSGLWSASPNTAAVNLPLFPSLSTPRK